MLYDVYENTIGMIEELEKYEHHGKSAGYSGLLRNRVPPTRKREKHDVSLPGFLLIRPTDTGNSATKSPGCYPHAMFKGWVMLIGKFELNPQTRPMWTWLMTGII